MAKRAQRCVSSHLRVGTRLAERTASAAYGRHAVSKLDSSLVIGRATFERWLGTEPVGIAAAAEALRKLEPEHPSLGDLEVRYRRALQIKAMLAEILHPELAAEDDEDWRRL
jgi:hypothetical protein